MGQTLTHGIYLPDEGERNCYNGLAANWSILDGAVGTVAEHTTALAGKAPAVHTHTVSQITDFPAYGNAAGTICEGNDSRLSDARTPVAHTHTKSDVTDLLNSNFIPSANNSYDLGSSSYQWKSVYAQSYYYNGTAWGLDKANEWTNNNTYQGNLYHKSGISTLVKGTNPSSATYYGSFRHITYDGTEINLFRGYIGTTGDNCYRWSVEPWVSGSNGRFQMRVSADGSVRAFEVDGTEVSPYTDNATDLGTSTKRWKTLNGVNPGALSLPDISGADPIDFSQWDVSGAAWTNYYTPSENGWLRITINDRATNSIYVVNSNDISSSAYGNGSQITGDTGRLVLFMPVRSGVRYQIIIKANSISDVGKAEFIPCNGNV